MGVCLLVAGAANSGFAQERANANVGPADLLPPVEAPGYRSTVEDHELWVLQLRLGGRVLADGVLAIDRSGEILLPLDVLADAYDLAIRVDARRARADGWIVHPGRPFELDLGSDVLSVEGARSTLDTASIVIWSGDIYVDAKSLSTWWPVDIEVDRRKLRIESIPRERLPVEDRLDRERLHRRMGMRSGAIERGGSRREYEWVSTPAIDVNLNSRVLRPVLGGSHDLESRYDIATAGDLLQLHTETLFTGIADEYGRLRARAGRRDIDGEMGGPLRMKEFAVGDVHTPSVSLLSQTRGGRGAQISNFPIDYYAELGQLTLEGDLRPGWDVELYRDEVLLDFASADSALRYRFEDVPTVPGLNVLRLVFHGPRGELREEERRVWMDGGLAPSGETRYRLTFNQHDEDLVRFGDVGGEEDLRGEPRGIAELEHGFSDAFTLALGAATLPLADGQHEYANVSARSQLAGSLVRVDLLGEGDGGFAGGAGWQTRLYGVTMGLQHHEYRDFLSERNRTFGGEDLLGRTEANLSGRVARFVQPFQYRLAFGASRLAGGRLDTDGLLRVSTWLRPLWLTHTLRGNLDRGDGVNTQQLDGDFLASYRRGALGMRGRLAYNADPGDLTSASLVGDWTPLPRTTTRLGVIHTFRERTTVLASLSRRLGPLVLSAHVEVDDKGLSQAGVGVSFGFTPDPYAGRPRIQAPGATRSGAVGARAFLDENANGVFDTDERPLPGIGFRARGVRNARTEADGTTLLTDLPVDQHLSVGLDPGTLEDPHWVTPREDERVVLRPGSPVTLDFPVVPVGEVDGFIRLGSGETAKPLPGVSVQLVDETGEVVQSTRSEIDGFFLFQKVIAGRYHLRVDPEHAARLDLVAPPALELEIDTAGDIVSDADLELTPDCARSQPGNARGTIGGLPLCPSPVLP